MIKRIRPKPTRFLFANLLALVISLLMLRAFVLPIMENQQAQSYQDQLTASANLISSFLLARKAEIHLMASAPRVQSMDWTVVGPVLTHLLEDPNIHFEKFILARPDSHFYATSGGNPHHDDLVSFDDTDPNAKLKSIIKRDYWRTTIRNNTQHKPINYVSNPMISYTTDIKQVVVASSILRDGKVVGLIGGSISWDEITNIIDSITEHGALQSHLATTPTSAPNTLSDSTFIEFQSTPAHKLMLVSKDGIYWYHWDKEKVIQTIKDINGDPITDDIGEKSVERHNILAESSDSLKSVGRNMVAGKQGRSKIELDDQSHYVFFMPIRDTNYSLAQIVDESTYHAPMYQLYIYLIVAFIAGMLVYIFCVYLIPNRRPK